MPTISYVSQEEFQALQNEVFKLQELLKAYVRSHEEWLPTATALRTSGVRTRETLGKYVRASAPNKIETGRITYRKVGRKCECLRSSCIDYAQRKLGLPSLSQ